MVHPQNSKQKHTTKKPAVFHNHFSPLTMGKLLEYLPDRDPLSVVLVAK